LFYTWSMSRNIFRLKKPAVASPPPSKQERRRLKRRKLAYYIVVLDALAEKTIGHLVDITPNGIMMDSRDPLPLEKEYTLRLDTSEDVADKIFITFIARTIWCLPDPVDIYLYDVGLSIVDIAESDAAILKRISEKYAAQDSFDLSTL
jgi:hypothetical protein